MRVPSVVVLELGGSLGLSKYTLRSQEATVLYDPKKPQSSPTTASTC